MTALCDRFNISRTTGHKLVKRFVEKGGNCLVTNSKSPLSNPQKTNKKIESYILKIRRKYPDWGARKLKVLLEERYPRKKIPFIHTDNGTPFGCMRSLRRFSKLCYWLIDLVITPIFSDPASPQQNGRHDRMHKDLKAYCRNKIQKALSKQQVVMDDFLHEYNNVRPHESLEMNKPANDYVVSDRKYTEKRIPFVYPLHYKIIKELLMEPLDEELTIGLSFFVPLLVDK